LKENVAPTGPDGKFSFNCNWITEPQFPVFLAVHHPDWIATRISGTQIERGGQWDGINIAIPMSEIELQPLRELSVSFTAKKVGSDWSVVGDCPY